MQRRQAFRCKSSLRCGLSAAILNAKTTHTMKLTKRQRHAIYKKAMRHVMDNGYGGLGLCMRIDDARLLTNEDFPSPYTSPECYPEFAAQRPPKTDPNDYWWDLGTPLGDAARTRALQRCIDMTAPTPRKK